MPRCAGEYLRIFRYFEMKLTGEGQQQGGNQEFVTGGEREGEKGDKLT